MSKSGPSSIATVSAAALSTQRLRKEVNQMTAQTVFKQSLQADVPEMATLLQEKLGQRLVAYVTHSKSNKTVGRWARGEHPPSPEAEGLLRALYRTVLILDAANEGDRTIRAWFTSPNPDLNEEVAAEVLRNGDSQRVFSAARAFAEVE
jgi:hypothetical protein